MFCSISCQLGWTGAKVTEHVDIGGLQEGYVVLKAPVSIAGLLITFFHFCYL